MKDIFGELAKQIEDTSVKLEKRGDVAYGVAWFERQMEWLGELRDGFKEVGIN